MGYTRVFEGVETEEIVALSAEFNALSAPSELFDQERVVLLHDLPHELPWYGRHLLLLRLQRSTRVLL